MVIFRFERSDGTTATRPPRRSTSQASSVACARISPGTSSARSSDVAAKDLGRLHRPQRGAVERLDHDARATRGRLRTSTRTGLGLHALDRVGDRRRGDRRIEALVACQRSQRPPHELRGGQRPRRVVDDDQVSPGAPGPAARSARAHRLRAHGPALDAEHARGRGHAGRQRDHDALDALAVTPPRRRSRHRGRASDRRSTASSERPASSTSALGDRQIPGARRARRQRSVQAAKPLYSAIAIWLEAEVASSSSR